MSGSRPGGEALLDALESGEVRVAEPVGDEWVVHGWVKEAILDLFRDSPLAEANGFVDKQWMPPRRFGLSDGVRLVPGGSAVRRGAYLAPGVICMPPMYVNVGAWVGAGSMIDSHALVGTCAQVGERVHVSAGCQIGGVLEPVGATPVIVEDDVLLGGLSGLFEGVLVRRGAVIAAGVVLSSGTRVFDLPRDRELERDARGRLEIPANAVVVPGTRPARRTGQGPGGRTTELDLLHVSCALIAKYRDERTDRATALEDALR